MSAPHRILMVIGQFSPITGGAERQCLRLARALKRRGHTVTVVTVWQSRDWPRREEIDGVPVERVWYPQLRLFGRKVLALGFLAWLTLAHRLRRILPECDVVHVHQGLWPAFSATLANLRAGKPMVCKIGNSGARFDLDVLRKSHLYGRLAVPLVKRKIDRFVWTSAAVLRDLQRAGVPARKLVHIPNGVDLGPETREVAARRAGEHADSVVQFLFVGSLTPKKNARLLPEALSRLPAEYRDRLRITILGDGPERTSLAARLRKDRLTESIHLAGFVNQPDTYFAASDVFVLPSLTEGLSNAALEAMTWGLPLILSSAGGNTDLIDDAGADGPARAVVEGRTGLLVDAGRPESLADAIRFMVDHPEKRRSMGRQAHEVAAARYAMERVAAQYEELYEECRFSRRENRR